jgi:hypothetical protein
MTKHRFDYVSIPDLYPTDDTIRFEHQHRDGSDVLRIISDKYNYTYGYYSNNPWVNGHILIVARFPELGQEQGCDLLSVDLVKKTAHVVANGGRGSTEFVVHGEHLYFIPAPADLWHMNLMTGEKERLYHQDGMHFPHMTADGRYLNWCRYEDNVGIGVVFDIATRTSYDLVRKIFAHPFTAANHMMICPSDPDCLFFAHEGTTQYISNRLWLAEKGKAPRNIAKQKLNADGDLGDCFGHECWAYHGNGLYFVKYACSPEPPRGLCYVDKVSGEAKLLWSAYPYWHVSCSPDDRFLGADTQNMGPGISAVCVVDQPAGEEKLLVKVRTNWKHPCHPHPCFNTESDRVGFNEFAEHEKCAVGFIDLC